MTDTRLDDRDLVQGDDTLGLDEDDPQDEYEAGTSPSAADEDMGGAPDDPSMADEADREPAEGRRDVG